MTFPSDGPGPDHDSPAGGLDSGSTPAPIPDAPGYGAPDLSPIGASGGPPVLGLQPASQSTWAPPPGWQATIPSRSRQASRRGVVAFILAIAIAFGAGGAVGFSASPAASGGIGLPQANVSFPPEFKVYEQAWQILQQNYVDPKALDPTTLTYGSISGLLSAVGDTDHTRFLSPQDLADENSSLSGTVVGIGAGMSTVNGQPIIQSVIPGSPAEKAGLVGGDTVLSVDGVSTDGESVDTVVSKIRGDAGTTVTLSILHTGASSPIDVSIVRAKVDVPSVSWALIPGTKVADIRIEQFATNATDELVTMIAAARTAGATSLVLDLRGNPGGYVDEAVGVASQFLKDGDVYREQDRSGKINEIAVKPGGTATDLPLAVLVDNGTASSAEIVSGAIQDAKRGTLIGEKTFGTGTVLSQFNLSDGSALLVGTIEWLTRDGRQIWKQGIVPDITLDSTPKGTIVTPSQLSTMTAAKLASSGDTQLIKAVSVVTGGS
ncbi:MAG TPA: S41 family peptidase [Candidatus Limnocylindrales bacterium]|nr:S41 family peptidase [Candidatus Limnocylindrales bacterium]